MNETASVPACVGIIMDGNRRWAKERGLQSLEGHAEGRKRAKEIVRHAFSRGVGTVVLYAFSTENWNRTSEEVNYLMELFGKVMMEDFIELSREGIHVRFIGDLARLPEKLRISARKLEDESAETSAGKTLVVALSYGGRAEIVAAANALLEEEATIADESALAQNLWSYPMPDPDLVIRTGGEKRLSGFLPWQTVYSELFFVDTFWPAFTKEEFDSILAEFAQRERRRGK